MSESQPEPHPSIHADRGSDLNNDNGVGYDFVSAGFNDYPEYSNLYESTPSSYLSTTLHSNYPNLFPDDQPDPQSPAAASPPDKELGPQESSIAALVAALFPGSDNGTPWPYHVGYHVDDLGEICELKSVDNPFQFFVCMSVLLCFFTTTTTNDIDFTSNS